MGYDTVRSTTTNMDITLDWAAINTALAVNMGILPLSNLVKYPGDNERSSLLNYMANAGKISYDQVLNTSSYYGKLLILYCICFHDIMLFILICQNHYLLPCVQFTGKY
jgi:hypothetical protein